MQYPAPFVQNEVIFIIKTLYKLERLGVTTLDSVHRILLCKTLLLLSRIPRWHLPRANIFVELALFLFFFVLFDMQIDIIFSSLFGNLRPGVFKCQNN